MTPWPKTNKLIYHDWKVNRWKRFTVKPRPPIDLLILDVISWFICGPKFQSFNVISFSFFPTNTTVCLHFKERKCMAFSSCWLCTVMHANLQYCSTNVSYLFVMHCHTFAQVPGLAFVFLTASYANLYGIRVILALASFSIIRARTLGFQYAYKWRTFFTSHEINHI